MLMLCLLDPNGTEMQSFLAELADELGIRWRFLARKLKLEENKIGSIEADFGETTEKAFQVLWMWYRQNGESGATMRKLGKAFEAIGDTILAAKCYKYTKEDKGEIKTIKEYQEKSKTTEPEQSSVSPVKESENSSRCQAEERACECCESTSSPKTARNNNQPSLKNCIKELDETLSSQLRKHLGEIPSCDIPALIAMSEAIRGNESMFEGVLHQLIQVFKPDVATTEDFNWAEEMTKKYSHRSKQRTQAIKLIQLQIESKKTRPKSEVPRRSTSYVKLIPRSFTEGDNNIISPPFLITEQTVIAGSPCQLINEAHQDCDESEESVQPRSSKCLQERLPSDFDTSASEEVSENEGNDLSNHHPGPIHEHNVPKYCSECPSPPIGTPPKATTTTITPPPHRTEDQNDTENVDKITWL